MTVWYNRLPEDEFRVIAVEEPFILSLRELAVPIIGYIDLLEEDESGTIVITDFKTSARSYGVEEVDKNFQLTIYQLAAKGNGYRNREILLKFDCLIKTKTPKFEAMFTTRTEVEEKGRSRRFRQSGWQFIKRFSFLTIRVGAVKTAGSRCTATPIWKGDKMNADTIKQIQSYLTVRQNGTSKKIVDVEVLLSRHGHDRVLSFLLDLLKEKQKKLVRLMEGDRSKREIDETVAQTFRLHMAIKVIEREMEEVKTWPS